MSTTLPLFEKVFSGAPEPTAPLTPCDLRDSGMESVIEHTSEEWKQKLKNRIRGFPVGYRFTMDCVVDEMGGRPYEVHPNAIGALTFGMAKQGLIKRTGALKKAKRASRHSADMPEWIRT